MALVAMVATVSLSSSPSSSSSLSSLFLVAGVGAAHPPSLQLNNNSHHHHNNNNKMTHSRQQHRHSSNIRGGSISEEGGGAKEVSSAAGVLLPIGNTMDINNISSNSPRSRASLVVVQPDSLHRNAVADNDARSVFTKVHPWPIPEDVVLQQQQQQQQLHLPLQQMQVSSETFRFNNNDDNVNVVSYYPQQQQQQQQQSPNEQYSQQQQQLRQGLHVANYMPSSLPQGVEVALLPSPLEDLDVISGKQVILRPRLSNNKNDYVGDVADPESKVRMMPPPPLGINAAESASSSSASSNNVAVVGVDSPPQSQPIVYYYDPQTLLQSPSVLLQSSSSSSSNGKVVENVDLYLDTTPELTLPEIVYTSSGTPLTLEQVHAGGKNEVFLEIKKPPPPKQEESAVWKSSASSSSGVVETEARMSSSNPWNAVQNKLLHLHNGGGSNSDASGAGSGGASWHSQDQLIVFFTVATMAIMVGALSARRLRNQRILESCMHPDLNDDDDDDDNLEDFHVIGSVTRSSSISRSRNHHGGGGIRYDKKYDLDTGVGGSRSVVSGFSAITGSGGVGKLKSSDLGALLGGGNYGTNGMNGGGGRLHWRGGDVEKFDV